MSRATERQVEALLFAAAGPLSLEDLARRLPANADVEAAIAGLQQRYEGGGVELACIAGRWRFQTAEDLAFLMTEEREEPRRLSKAAQETLAIIAYHQPVTPRRDRGPSAASRPARARWMGCWSWASCACADAAALRAGPSPMAPPRPSLNTMAWRTSRTCPVWPR
jgi:hypothetical protein